tara:strand:- start:6234 stop:6440 length:207 start_codon:yes stop_codon:yes gene_type:complete
MAEEKDGLSKVTKLVAAVTALLVALGTLVGAITVTLGGGNDNNPYQGGMTIILDSPAAYEAFLANHPG